MASQTSSQSVECQVDESELEVCVPRPLQRWIPPSVPIDKSVIEDTSLDSTVIADAVPPVDNEVGGSEAQDLDRPAEPSGSDASSSSSSSEDESESADESCCASVGVQCGVAFSRVPGEVVLGEDYSTLAEALDANAKLIMVAEAHSEPIYAALEIPSGVTIEGYGQKSAKFFANNPFVLVGGDDPPVLRNIRVSCRGRARTCIYAEKGAALVEHCQVVGGQFGVVAEATSKLVMQHCQVEHQDAASVCIRDVGSGCRLVNNTFSHCKLAALSMSGKFGEICITLSDNKICESQIGISLQLSAYEGDAPLRADLLDGNLLEQNQRDVTFDLTGPWGATPGMQWPPKCQVQTLHRGKKKRNPYLLQIGGGRIRVAKQEKDENPIPSGSSQSSKRPRYASIGENPYKTLGLTRTANEKEINAKYRQMARDLHPDKNEDDTSEQFYNLKKAHEKALDDVQRREDLRKGIAFCDAAKNSHLFKGS